MKRSLFSIALLCCCLTITLPGSSVDVTVKGFTSITCSTKKDTLPISVMSMWSGAGKHPTVGIAL